MKVKIKKLNAKAILPKRGSMDAAGYDIYVAEDTVVHNGRQVIPTYLSVELPKWHYAGIEPRSGNESKGIEGIPYHIWACRELGIEKQRFDCDVLRGIVDADYRGPIGVIVNNHGCEFVLPRGSKIAQMVLHEFKTMDFEVVDELSDTERAGGGFGSTDHAKEG
jgi:dUTP pyrophosphatase